MDSSDDDFRHAPDLTPDDLPAPRRKRRSAGHTAHPPRPRHTDPGHTHERHGPGYTSESHRLGRHYGGWRRSPFDPLREIADPWGIQLRMEVDPRGDLPPVVDQGRLGSCTANATAAAFEYDAMLDGQFTGPLSRLWIYYQERRQEGVLGKGDTGARGSDAFAVASEIGIPQEVYWPYDITTFQGPPPARATDDEPIYRLRKPYLTPPLNRHAFRQILSNQQTISFGFLVYESFESAQVARTGIVPVPGADEQVLGGHEVLAVGYLKSEPQHVLVRNSWGSRQLGRRGWGINGSGYCLMPWRLVLDPRLAGDHTTIHRPIYRR